MKNHNHGLWMMLCCLLPLLAIFFSPSFGVRSNGSILFFVLMMFACHFLMMGGHGGHEYNDKEDNKNSGDTKENNEGHEKKEGHHGCH